MQLCKTRWCHHSIPSLLRSNAYYSIALLYAIGIKPIRQLDLFIRHQQPSFDYQLARNWVFGFIGILSDLFVWISDGRFWICFFRFNYKNSHRIYHVTVHAVSIFNQGYQIFCLSWQGSIKACMVPTNNFQNLSQQGHRLFLHFHLMLWRWYRPPYCTGISSAMHSSNVANMFRINIPVCFREEVPWYRFWLRFSRKYCSLMILLIFQLFQASNSQYCQEY